MLVTVLRWLVDMKYSRTLDFSLFTKEKVSQNYKF